MPRLVILNAGPDLAGVGINLKRAFDRYAPDWEARAVCRQKVYLDYPTDIVWTLRDGRRMRHEIRALVSRADVVHVMDNEKALGWFPLHGKTVVVQHLGSHYRRRPREVSAVCRRYGAIEVTDSIDLMNPGVEFLPATVDLEALAAIRKATYRPSERIRIAHAPTDRPNKSTASVIRAVEALSKRYPIDFDLIERVPNRVCLARKAQADIVVDQLKYGFGVNNIESWAMGIPVVSGWENPEHRQRSLELFGRLPWADATEATLEAVIEHLIEDPDWRHELGERGRAHAEVWHSQKAVVERTLAVYERARQIREKAA